VQRGYSIKPQGGKREFAGFMHFNIIVDAEKLSWKKNKSDNGTGDRSGPNLGGDRTRFSSPIRSIQAWKWSSRLNIQSSSRINATQFYHEESIAVNQL